MKLFGLSAIAVALVSMSNVHVAEAKSCVKGGIYCGQSLLNRGNYLEDIRRKLREKGQPTEDRFIMNSLWDCGSGGDIFYKTWCSAGCGGVGSTQDDYCL